MNMKRVMSTAKNLPARWRKARSPKRKKFAELLKQIQKNGYTSEESAQMSRDYLNRARDHKVETAYQRAEAEFLGNYFKDLRKKPQQLYLKGTGYHPPNEAEAEKFVKVLNDIADGHDLRAKENRENAVAHRLHSIKSRAPTMREKVNSTKAARLFHYLQASKDVRRRLAAIDSELFFRRKSVNPKDIQIISELNDERASLIRRLASKRNAIVGPEKFLGPGAYVKRFQRKRVVKQYKKNLEVLRDANDGALVGLMVKSFDIYNSKTDAASKRKAKEGTHIQHAFVLNLDNLLSRKRVIEYIAMAMAESGTKLNAKNISKKTPAKEQPK